MISTEIYIEDEKIDLLQDISTEFTYAIDDVSEFGSRNTSFSKTDLAAVSMRVSPIATY